jgi:ATP-dependent exoDNAse (exonuclease V) alpha subunit
MLSDASPIRFESVTSHSSQGQSADRVLLQVDTARKREALVNRRLAYVAISRGRYDAQLYTNDKAHLAGALGREVSAPVRDGTDPGP